MEKKEEKAEERAFPPKEGKKMEKNTD